MFRIAKKLEIAKKYFPQWNQGTVVFEGWFFGFFPA